MSTTIYTQSGPLSKALTAGNSNAIDWAALEILELLPVADGRYAAGEGGAYAPNRLFLMPYCEGGAGAAFSMRIIGWRAFSQPGDRKQVSIPYLICELACVACNVGGPSAPIMTPPYPNIMAPTERVCDDVVLALGSLGCGPSGPGFINSAGAGSDIPASALVDLGGCQLFQFDFKTTGPVTANCLWARA